MPGLSPYYTIIIYFNLIGFLYLGTGKYNTAKYTNHKMARDVLKYIRLAMVTYKD